MSYDFNTTGMVGGPNAQLGQFALADDPNTELVVMMVGRNNPIAEIDFGYDGDLIKRQILAGVPTFVTNAQAKMAKQQGVILVSSQPL